jgi:hypothetical protein
MSEMYHENYPSEFKTKTIEEFVSDAKEKRVKSFYIKVVFVDVNDFEGFEKLMSRVTKTDATAFKNYMDLPMQERFPVNQKRLVWLLQNEEAGIVDVHDFPKDRLWNMLLQFAPSQGLKFKRTQFQFEDGFSEGIARMHFFFDDLPF